MSKFTVERTVRIWNDTEGESTLVCPDGDGLGLIEIRSLSKNEEITRRITVSREEAVLLAAALAEYCGDDRNFPDDVKKK
jgi:hypothetical protein